MNLKGKYEHALYNFMLLKTHDARVFDLNYVSSLTTFKKLKNEKLIKDARNEFIKQGLIICFYSWDLDGRDKILHDGTVFNFSELIWLLDYREQTKIFLDASDEHFIKTEYQERKKKFGARRVVLNVSLFDYEKGFNSFTDGVGVDEMNRNWKYHWGQTYDFWKEKYYPFIKNDLI